MWILCRLYTESVKKIPSKQNVIKFFFTNAGWMKLYENNTSRVKITQRKEIYIIRLVSLLFCVFFEKLYFDKWTPLNIKKNKLEKTLNIDDLLLDDQVAAGTNSLNSKQREVFSMLHTCAKDYVKYDGGNVKPVHVSISDNEGTSKSHLMKLIHNAISKTLVCHYKDQEKPRVVLLTPICRPTCWMFLWQNLVNLILAKYLKQDSFRKLS